MKVLLLVTDAYGGHGGIALYNRDLIEAFAQMNDVERVDVVPRVKRFDIGEVPAKVRFFADAIGSRWRFSLRSLQLALGRPDVFVCGHIHLLPIAYPLARLMRRPLVLVVHGIDVWTEPATLLRKIAKRVDRIWSVSAVTRDRMNAWAKLPIERYALLPGAIRLERYGDDARDVSLLEKWRVSSDAKVLLTIARLAGFERYKGIDEVLAAMPELLKRHPNLVYVVAGDGSDLDRLKAVAEDKGVANRVRFVGLVTEPEKIAWLRSANAFVLPGRGEGFGFVFLEARAAGTPAVGSLLDGSREALLDGKLGYLVNPDDLQSVIGGIELALASQRGVPSDLSFYAFGRFSERLREETGTFVSGAG